MDDLADILRNDSLDKRALVNSIPAMEIVAELPLLFSTEDETLVCKGLDLLTAICENSKEPAQAKLMVSTALYALDNESADVHARTLAIVKRFACPLDAPFAEELRGRLDLIHPSQRVLAEALLATACGGAAVSVVNQTGDGAGGASESLESLLNQYNSLDEKWRNLAGCAEALDAARGETPLVEAIRFNANDVLRLDPDARIQPVREADELIDLFMRGLESQLLEHDLERLLDGAARIKRARGGDYWDARLTGLGARAKQNCNYLGALALAWAFGSPPEADQYFESLFHKRVNAVATKLAAGEPVFLLATPTHAGLWIDARMLVDRAREIGDVDTAITTIEQVQALLRLAPDHRDEALSAAEHLKGEFGCAMRYALGSNSESLGANVPLWVAAIRARTPLTEPYCMMVKLMVRDYPLIGRCLSPQTFETETVKLLGQYIESRSATHDMVALIGDMDIGNIKSPLCTEVYWARQFRSVSESRASGSNYWQEDRWEQLFESDLPIGTMALHSLIYGLAVSSPEARMVAINALTKTIFDGRVDGKMIASILADHFSDLNTKLWLEALHAVSRVSALHAQVVQAALETLISSGPNPDPDPQVSILDVLYEISRRINRGITCDTARKYLFALKGGGTAGALAQNLLQLSTSQNSENSKSAGLIALKQRIKRANRWQAWYEATLAAGHPR
ncbi:MAG: DUF6493 family protein [Candidatus Melainabacteria bacterium]|nr:DUF6493 family protein [Candidatus Melainabacteria bacterium]